MDMDQYSMLTHMLVVDGILDNNACQHMLDILKQGL